MPVELDPAFLRIVQFVQSAAADAAEMFQRVVIIAADLFLILFALIALKHDWNHTCDDTLHVYGLMCVALCVLDIVWECLRCSLERELDQLQLDCKSEVAVTQGRVSEGLLGDEAQEGVGQPRVDVTDEKTLVPSSTSCRRILGRGIRKEKALKQKRTADLHFWSIVFSCFVSLIFSLFAAHDERCAEYVPFLYKYIHIFTYVFIFRLGVILLWICCRTVKDYEDAANAAFVEAARQQAAVPMRAL